MRVVNKDKNKRTKTLNSISTIRLTTALSMKGTFSSFPYPITATEEILSRLLNIGRSGHVFAPRRPTCVRAEATGNVRNWQQGDEIRIERHWDPTGIFSAFETRAAS